MSKRRRNSSSSVEDKTPETLRNQATPKHAHQSVDVIDSSFYSDPDEDVDEQPQIDPLYGQAGAFPGLNRGKEPFYGPANDGLDYLRMVQSERQSIPGLLRSKTQPEITSLVDSEGDGGFWDNDGTFTAQPLSADDSSEFPHAQLYYYEALMVQYTQLREQTHTVPPLSAIERLTSSQPISFPRDNKNAKLGWEQCLKTRDPSPTQIACMDNASIFQLLELIRTKMRGLLQHHNPELVKRLGAWIWSILAKCPDRGSLGSEEISDLRKLAEKAIDTRDWLEKVYKPGEPREVLLDDEHDSEDEIEDEGQQISFRHDESVESEIHNGIEAARQRLHMIYSTEPSKTSNIQTDKDLTMHSVDHEEAVVSAKETKFVILDMIVSVVGEFYGQRDLLEARKIWIAGNVTT